MGRRKTCVPGHACLRSPEAASPSRPAAVLHKLPHKLPSLFICTKPIVKVSHIYGLRVAGGYRSVQPTQKGADLTALCAWLPTSQKGCAELPPPQFLLTFLRKRGHEGVEKKDIFQKRQKKDNRFCPSPFFVFQ